MKNSRYPRRILFLNMQSVLRKHIALTHSTHRWMIIHTTFPLEFTMSASRQHLRLTRRNLTHAPMNQNILALPLRRVCKSLSNSDGQASLHVPFFAPWIFDGLADSSWSVSTVVSGGATILTAADRDCGLAKNAMHGLSAVRRRRLLESATSGRRRGK